MLEKLLEVLASLVVALNNNTEALKASATKTPRGGKKEDAAPPANTSAPATEAPATLPPAAEPPPAPKFTEKDVADAANGLMDANGNDGSAIAALNKKFNVPVIDGKQRLSRAEPEKREAIIAELKKLTEEAKEAKKAKSGGNEI